MTLVEDQSPLDGVHVFGDVLAVLRAHALVVVLVILGFGALLLVFALLGYVRAATTRRRGGQAQRSPWAAPVTTTLVAVLVMAGGLTAGAVL